MFFSHCFYYQPLNQFDRREASGCSIQIHSVPVPVLPHSCRGTDVNNYKQHLTIFPSFRTHVLRLRVLEQEHRPLPSAQSADTWHSTSFSVPFLFPASSFTAVLSPLSAVHSFHARSCFHFIISPFTACVFEMRVSTMTQGEE